MSGRIAPFRERYRKALADPQLRQNLLSFQRAWQAAREQAIDRLEREVSELGPADASFARERAQLIAAKEAVLEDPAAVRARFVRNAGAAGAVVHQVESAAAARDVILRILRGRGVRLLAKGKSMVAEEIFLSEHLERAGIRVVETDLGEWIVQLAREMPSHMVMPAIHKNRRQVGALFEQETGKAVPYDDIRAQVDLARRELRQAFLEAGAGLIGANALIAETGTVLLITNEGNGDLVSTLPKTLIVLAGWEKLLPTLEDAKAQLRLLARSATGQEITSYTSFITGPEPGRELHIVLLDNGRTAMWSTPGFRDALRCIRCAACADVCPAYQVVGGQVFGHVYSGAIGLVNTPFHHGLEAVAGPQSLCVSCNACATVCPVEIPLPQQILDVRTAVVETQGLPPLLRIAHFVWTRPWLFDLLTRAGAVLQAPFRSGSFLRLPLPRRWRWRATPALSPRPARDRLLGRTFEPDRTGPWSNSRVAGSTVAYFIQCLTDRFAAEQAEAVVQVLRALGARVVVPAGQHCCGLPQLDAGDRSAARDLAKQTIAALEAVQADYIVTAAASCAAAMLHEYRSLLEDEPAWQERARRLLPKLHDAVSFVEEIAQPPALPEARTAPVTTYHRFCQSANLLQLGDVGERLLQRAGIAIVPLGEAEVCCGFGGSTSVLYPEVGRGIVERKLENVRATGAARLCTDNPGCILHLRGAARAAGMPLEVRHVLELVAERLAQHGSLAGTL